MGQHLKGIINASDKSSIRVTKASLRGSTVLSGLAIDGLAESFKRGALEAAFEPDLLLKELDPMMLVKTPGVFGIFVSQPVTDGRLQCFQRGATQRRASLHSPLEQPEIEVRLTEQVV